MKPRSDTVALGVVSAVIAGSAVVYADGLTGVASGFLEDPTVVGYGLIVAAGGGAMIARRVVETDWLAAVGFAIMYGALVPIATVGLMFPPFAPLTMPFAMILWPATVPAGLIWLVLVRVLSSHRPGSLLLVRAGFAAALSLVLMGLHYAEPSWTLSAAGSRCLGFPGESIGSIAWSPDGEWLGIGSQRDDIGTVRVYERRTGRIVELARGWHVMATHSGIAVGPGGETAYVVNRLRGGTTPDLVDASVWVASPTERSRRHAILPTPALDDLTYTEAGLVAVQKLDEHDAYMERLVWIDPGSSVARPLREVTLVEQSTHPVFAPLVDPDHEHPMTFATPNGLRHVAWPTSWFLDLSVTRDGAYLVFIEPDPESLDEASDIVVMSTVSGRTTVLAHDDASYPQLAGRWLAYVTEGWPSNSVCLREVVLEP